MTVFTVPTPDVDSFLQSYKVIAKLLQKKEAVPLTQAQHNIAKSVGLKDWQSFHYSFQMLSRLELDLDKYEWFFIFQSTSELEFDIHLSTEILLEKIKFYEHNFISNSSKSISEKIQKMTDIQRKALLATCLLYLKRPYFKIHETIFKENFDLIEEKNKKKYQDFKINHNIKLREIKNIFKDQSFSNMPGFSKFNLNIPQLNIPNIMPNLKDISALFSNIFIQKNTIFEEIYKYMSELKKIISQISLKQ